MTDQKSPEPETKRKAKIERTIRFADGSTGKRLKTGLEPTGFNLKWLATGESLDCVLDAVPASTKANGLVFGLTTNITNAAGGKDATFQDMADRFELIMAGEWAELAGEGGPSPTLLAEAWHKASAARGRTTFSDGSAFTLEGVVLKVKSMDAEARKAVKNDPYVKAAYAEIEADRAKERAKKAKADLKASGGAEDGGADNLL